MIMRRALGRQTEDHHPASLHADAARIDDYKIPDRHSHHQFLRLDVPGEHVIVDAILNCNDGGVHQYG